MVQITPLLHAIPVLSWFAPPNSASNGLAVRQTIDPNSIPAACQSSCQVENTIANCAGSLSCMCTNTVGNQLLQCMDCVVSSDPTGAQLVISDWNQLCGGNLSLSGGSSSGGTTGSTTGGTITTGGTTGGTIPATTTGTSSSSSSVPSSTSTSGAVDLKIGSRTVCIVAALAGAFIFL